MEWKQYLFDEVKNPATLQVLARGVIVFLSAVILLRLGAKRTFGKGNALDNVVVIILGGMLSRVITGAAAYIPVVAATAGILITGRILGRLNMYPAFTKIIAGKKTLLFQNGKPVIKNMKLTLVSQDDLYEASRLRLNTENMEEVNEMYMETNGEISVTKKNK